MNKNQSCDTQWELSDVVIEDKGQEPLFCYALCGAHDYIQVVSLPIALVDRGPIVQTKTGSGKVATLALALLARFGALYKLRTGKMEGKKVRVRLMDE